MKRGSLLGPLLIILIGVLFLTNALWPELPLLEIAARYWPFLLIGWGLLRLVEVFATAGRARVAPAPVIRGGEWVLIVLVCLIGSGLYAANRFRPWQHMGMMSEWRIRSFGRNYDFPIPEQQVPVGKAPRILIENLSGNARIVGVEGQELKVSGHKAVRALQESDANQANQQTPVEVTTQGNQVVVRTNQDRLTGDPNITTDLELTVPRGATIEGRGRKGDFEISDTGGNVEISSDNAGVRVENIGGSVRLDLRRSDLVRAVNVKGSVEVNGVRGQDIELENIGGEVGISGSYSGDLQFRNLAKPLRIQDPRTTDLRVEKVPGQLHMDLGELTGTRLVGPIRLSSRSRDVQIDDFTDTAEISLDRGDVSLRPVQVPLPKIDVHTRAGQVELALPASASFRLTATTRSGGVTNEFGPVLRDDAAGTGEDRRKHRRATLEGGTGQGPQLTLLTDRGSITVRKDSLRQAVEVGKPERF